MTASDAQSPSARTSERLPALKLLSVVDRPRPGLSDISDGLVENAARAGFDASSLHRVPGAVTAGPRWSLRAMLHAVRACDAVVVWSFGLTAMLLPLLRAWYPQTHWAVVLHEPGGLRAKLSKGDGWLRAFASAALEFLAVKGADTVLVPRADKAALVSARRVVVAPLLYCTAAVATLSTRTDVLYMGRRDARRKLAFFESDAFRQRLRDALGECGFSYFPPTADQPAGYAQKLEALSKAGAILNFYTVPYNQSGVTVEALMNGVPVIVSEFDPHAPDLAALGLVLPCGVGDVQLSEAVAQAMRKSDALRPKLLQLGDRLGGSQAFATHWLPWLASLPRRSLFPPVS